MTLLLTAYGGRNDGLFVAAAAESQSFGPMLDDSQSQFEYDRLVNRTECSSKQDTLACLRSLDVDSLQRKNYVTPLPGASGNPLYLYGPTIDRDLVQDYTLRLFHAGKFIKVPVIFGDDTNEGTIFVPRNTSSVSQADTFIKDQFPTITDDQLSKINEMYLTEDKTRTFPNAGPYWPPTCTAYGELRYICPGIDLSSVYAAAGVPSWNYHYAVLDPDAETSGTGTSHTVEVNALWGPDYVSGVPPPSYYTTNAGIIPVIQGYWASFVRSLDPNTHRDSSSPEWKTWGEGDNAFWRIFMRTNQTRMERVPQEQQKRCNYLLSLGEDLRQ